MERLAEQPNSSVVEVAIPWQGGERGHSKHDEATRVESLFDLPCDSESTAQERILSIVDYLSRIQR